MFRIVGRHGPPPAGLPSPLVWGNQQRLGELFADAARTDVTGRQFHFRFRAASEFFETFKTCYGPIVRAWNALDAEGQQSLRDELMALADSANRDTTGALTVPSDYLEVVITRGFFDDINAVMHDLTYIDLREPWLSSPRSPASPTPRSGPPRT